jgi:uncharacterized protein YciI
MRRVEAHERRARRARFSGMYAIVLIRYRVPLETVQAHTDDHRAYLRSLKDAGTLLASGPFDPRTGGAFLVRLPDDGPAAALDAIRDNDPFWQRGVANYELIPWAPVIGRESLDAIT